MVGMVSLCVSGVVQDWYCLIDSLVIWHSHVTCVFIANTWFMAFIYTYISLVCSYVVLPLVRNTCNTLLHVTFLPGRIPKPGKTT